MSRGEKPRRATKTGLWLIVQNSKHLIMAFGYEPFFHVFGTGYAYAKSWSQSWQPIQKAYQMGP
jgi:hypothetical protein